MISAFGVDHGISKAFKALGPKIARARMHDTKVVEHRNMNEKLRRHALEHRFTAGSIGASMARRATPEKRAELFARPGGNKRGTQTPKTLLEARREAKVGAQKIYDALGREGRKNKVLP